MAVPETINNFDELLKEVMRGMFIHHHTDIMMPWREANEKFERQYPGDGITDWDRLHVNAMDALVAVENIVGGFRFPMKNHKAK